MKKKVVDPLLPGSYGKMSARELDREVAVFDQEFIADAARPLSAADRARLRRARTKGTTGQKKRVVVSLDSGLVIPRAPFQRPVAPETTRPRA